MKILANFSDYNHTPERKKRNTYGAIGYYRIVKPASCIKGHQVDVIGTEILKFGRTLEEQWDNVFKEYDVYWTNYFCDDAAGSAMLYHAQKHNKQVWIDVDDNYLDIPESNMLYDRFKKTKRDRAMLSTILSLANVITTSTFPLKERLHEHFKGLHNLDKKILVIPNMNDISDWDFTPAPKHEKKLVIGYTGSNSHQDDLKMVMPSVAKLMKKHKHVHFELVGAIGKDKIKEYFAFAGFDDDSLKRIDLLPSTATFKEYPEYLSQQKWDIGLAPLVDTPFTRSKSSIKFFEYSMFKIPTIASRVYPYFVDIMGRKVITDGVTGLLCRNSEWETKLERLILDKDLRKSLGENAYQHVKDNWQYKDSSIGQIIGATLDGK